MEPVQKTSPCIGERATRSTVSNPVGSATIEYCETEVELASAGRTG